MAKRTLLELTQTILSAMDSDDVNSISDTVEATQVAHTIIDTYYELMAGRTVPSMEGLLKLDALADVTRPNYLKLPENVKSIKWVRYNGTKIPYIEPEEFLDNAFGRTDGVLITDPSFSSDYYIFDDADPTYWTTFDNDYLVFNGYDSATDSTLQQTKTTCWGQYDPAYAFTDDAYAPYLSGDDYPGLLAEATSVCFINYKQVSSAKEEQKSKRQRVRQQNDLWRGDQRRPYDRRPNYGRKS